MFCNCKQAAVFVQSESCLSLTNVLYSYHNDCIMIGMKGMLKKNAQVYPLIPLVNLDFLTAYLPEFQKFGSGLIRGYSSSLIEC